MGDIILSNGTVITASELAEIAGEVKKLIAKESKEPSQYEEVNSLSGLTTLPALLQSGSSFRLVRAAVELLKGRDGKEVDMRSTTAGIEWKLGDGEWTSLFDFSTIRGDTGLTGQGISYQWTSTALTLGTITPGETDVVWGDPVELKGEKGNTGSTGQGFAYEWDGTKLKLGIIPVGESSTTWGDPVDLKGEKGDKGEPFTYDDFTEDQISELSRPATEAAEYAISLSENLPMIENMTWRVFNPSTNQYEDSGVDATGKPPIIQSGTWWLWDYATQSYVDSGQSINSSYKAYVPRKYASDVDLSSLSTYEDDGETKAFTTGNMIFVENELEPTGYSVYIYTPSGSGFAWVKLVLITDGMNLVLVNK